MSITVSTQITNFSDRFLIFVVTRPERKHFIEKNFAFANMFESSTDT